VGDVSKPIKKVQLNDADSPRYKPIILSPIEMYYCKVVNSARVQVMHVMTFSSTFYSPLFDTIILSNKELQYRESNRTGCILSNIKGRIQSANCIWD
jgi:hypothetical protein